MAADRFDWLIAAALAAAFLLLALPGIGEPARPLFDEVLHVVVASELLREMEPSDFAHPPVARLLIALGLALGPGPFDPAMRDWTAAQAFAWRVPAAIAGAAAVAMLYGLARSILGARLPATLAALLLALDGVFLVHARIGMTNAFALAFTIAAALATWLAIARDRPAWLWAAGLATGLAIGTRWTGALAAVALVVAVVASRRPWQGVSAATLRAWLPPLAGGFGLLAPAVYMASFAPFVLIGPEPDWQRLTDLSNWGAVIALNQQMYAYHQTQIGVHPYHSPWWSWPAMAKPLWYEFAYHPRADTVVGLGTIGNPALWWPAVPALAFALWRGVRRDAPGLVFVAWLGFALWLPWCLTARPTTFMTYMLESMPFAAIAIAAAVQAIPAPRAAALVALGWAGAAAGLLAFFHPLLTLTPITREQFLARVWMRDWDAVTVIHDFRASHGLLDRRMWEAYLRGLGNQKWHIGGPKGEP